mgnify:FL=1|jgi:16S rRNA pseudouridine516 synthase
MQSSRSRLDRFLRANANISRRHVREILARGRVTIDGTVARDINQVIDVFSHVTLDGETLQKNQRRNVILNKPRGVVSATRDHKNKTVIDLLDFDYKEQLHIVGRLDFNSTGLLLLSNDGAWSRELTSPEGKVAKRYTVGLENPIDDAYIDAFRNGMYFKFEDITTLPAGLKILDPHTAEVTLVEGRYHQIKRMFGRFDNKVVTLHRDSIGNLSLDKGLIQGESRELTADEVAGISES